MTKHREIAARPLREVFQAFDEVSARQPIDAQLTAIIGPSLRLLAS